MLRLGRSITTLDCFNMNLNQIKANVSIVCNSFVGLIERRMLISPLVSNRKLAEAYDKTYEANVFNRIRAILYLDLLREAYAILGDSRRDAVTLSTIMSYMESEPIMTEVKKEYCRPREINWIGPIDDESRRCFEERNAKECIEKTTNEFGKIRSNSKKQWESFRASPLFLKIKTCRHKVIAHKGVTAENGLPRLQEISDFGLMWGDCEKYMDHAEPIVEGCGILFQNTSYGFEGAREHFQKLADGFWKTCVGPQASKRRI